LSVDQLILINNALNEILNGSALGVEEFQTRVSFEPTEAKQLSTIIQNIIDKQ